MRGAITEALMTRTQSLAGGYPVAWENTRIEPGVPDTVYLQATLLPASETPENILGSQIYSVAIGIWQVLVVGPAAGAAPMGPGSVNAIVDAIKAHFRPGTELTPTSDTSVTVRLERAEDAPAIPGVERYTVPVSVRFRASRVH